MKKLIKKLICSHPKNLQKTIHVEYLGGCHMDNKPKEPKYKRSTMKCLVCGYIYYKKE